MKKNWEKKIRHLKLKLFLLFTLPVAVVTVGHAVIQEYLRVSIRKASAQIKKEEEAKRNS